MITNLARTGPAAIGSCLFCREVQHHVEVSHTDERPLPDLADAATTRGVDAALAAARHGDEDAFRTLYREINPRLLRYLRTLVGDEAEDVASEAWLQIARDIASFAGDADAFRGWTATIARNRALDHIRHRKRRLLGDVPADGLADRPASDDTERTVLDTLSTERAFAMIGRLPRDQAEIIVLRVVVGLDATTVGKILGKRAGAVRTAAHRGLRRLEQLLNDPEHQR